MPTLPKKALKRLNVVSIIELAVGEPDDRFFLEIVAAELTQRVQL